LFVPADADALASCIASQASRTALAASNLCAGLPGRGFGFGDQCAAALQDDIGKGRARALG
jgi:hypothetical protein